MGSNRRLHRYKELIYRGENMTDEQFNQLKKNIEQIMQKLDNLQKLYKKETGRWYVEPVYLKAKSV